MSLMQKEGVIWLDGEYVPWGQGQIHALTHTLHYGVGVFEGVRAYETSKGPAIFRLKDHTDRLFHSAHIMNMTIPYDKEIINKVHQEIIKINHLHSAYIRPLVFYGAESLSLRVDALSTHVMIAAWEWPSYLGLAEIHQGILVKTASFTRSHVNSVFCKAKTSGNYLNSIIALQEAVANGCEEALLLDQQGYVAEGSGENIFIIRNGVLYTPDSGAILEGITRDTIFTLAKDNGLSVVERRITRDEVYIADEAFFTGTAVEVIPIREVDGRMIGNGQIGPITKMLQGLYMDVVRGKLTKYQRWLT